MFPLSGELISKCVALLNKVKLSSIQRTKLFGKYSVYNLYYLIIFRSLTTVYSNCRGIVIIVTSCDYKIIGTH